ncbi:MAG: hypothetical protein IPP77_13155 [Bacteroidetes bacterium]|nr:hypothetical protein [Bacteroidota bacterium]
MTNEQTLQLPTHDLRMKNKITRQIKRITKSIGLSAQCFLLLLKNLILIKTLRVKSVWLYDRVVIQGNEVELFWKVKGCHKIRVAGIGTIKGSLTGIRFKLADITKPIQICFYGIAKRKTETVFFNGAKINLLNKFYTDSTLPIAFAVPYNRENLDCQFSNSKLETNFENITFEFDSFDLNKYEPLKITQS